jgi:hypothetical protein
MSATYLGAAEARELVGRFRDAGYGRGNRFASVSVRATPGGYGEERHREHERLEWERTHPGLSWWEREAKRREWERCQPGVPFVGVEALMGAVAATQAAAAQGVNPALAAAQAYGFAPRAIMVPAAEPTEAARQTLPMNTGGQVVGTTVAALITSRPQRQAFKPQRVFVSNASSPNSILGGGGPADWLLNDISIGNISQYVQAGSLPGDIFQSTAIDSYVSFMTAQTAMDVTMSVTYNGTGSTSETPGLPFWGSIHGVAAV